MHKVDCQEFTFWGYQKRFKTIICVSIITYHRSFGSVKTVRVPRKFDGQHRGFGFVAFLTHQDAKTALETLGATHLYGRHLVLEWAKEEESMEEMRQKTAKNFKSEVPEKKRRIEMEEEEEY